MPKYCAPEFGKPRKSIFDRQHGIAGEWPNFARKTAGTVDDQKLRFARCSGKEKNWPGAGHAVACSGGRSDPEGQTAASGDQHASPLHRACMILPQYGISASRRAQDLGARSRWGRAGNISVPIATCTDGSIEDTKTPSADHITVKRPRRWRIGRFQGGAPAGEQLSFGGLDRRGRDVGFRDWTRCCENLAEPRSRRTVDRACARVPEHAHDWPMLSLFVLGGYRNQTELGTTFVAGPSAILYRAGAAHRNIVASAGFEQIEIKSIPWLGHAKLPAAPVSRWLGGRAGAKSRALVQVCVEKTAEERLRKIVQRFAAREPAANRSARLRAGFRRLCGCCAMTRR